MTSQYNLETLNAYVDGELSARDQAEVANAIASDPDLARQTATLCSLKAALNASQCGDFGDNIEIEFPEPDKRLPDFSWVAVAAGIVVTAAVIASLLFGHNWLAPEQGLKLAQEAHRHWLESSKVEFAQRNNRHFTAVSRVGVDAYIPDLSQVKLDFSGIRQIQSSDARGLHIGYRGPSGCMVSLVIVNKARGLNSQLTYFSQDSRNYYGWQIEQTGFYLLADKMDPDRLKVVAEVVNRLTRERLPLDSESILALNESRSESQPCLT